MTPLMFGTQVLFPIILMIMMLGLGLSLSGEDFTRVLRTPRPAIVGILGHAIYCPCRRLPYCRFSIFRRWWRAGW